LVGTLAAVPGCIAMRRIACSFPSHETACFCAVLSGVFFDERSFSHPVKSPPV
jgi:hypothetical protein